VQNPYKCNFLCLLCCVFFFVCDCFFNVFHGVFNLCRCVLLATAVLTTPLNNDNCIELYCSHHRGSSYKFPSPKHPDPSPLLICILPSTNLSFLRTFIHFHSAILSTWFLHIFQHIWHFDKIYYLFQRR
jgi:hypothetical protein